MKSIAIITARGGSKRIPKKNIREFLGKPILHYSIQAALDAGVFDEVMVSTDDETIQEIALKAGAAVPFLRSAETSGDFATTADVLREVLREYAKAGKEFTHAVVLYPTAPFVTGEKLKAAMELLEEKDADSVLPVVRFSYPPQRGFVSQDGKIRFREEEYAKARSQDLEPVYHDCGQFCCFNTKRFLESGTLVTENTYSVEYPESEVQDIDSYEDWEMAEMKYMQMLKKISKGNT